MVPGLSQKFDCVIDSINCTDITLEAATCLVRANIKKTREDFEAERSSLIEVYPCHRPSYSTSQNANVSIASFQVSRRSAGADL